jgi:hypothetical protein
MKLAALLVDIRRRARILPAPDVDPFKAITFDAEPIRRRWRTER